MKRESSFNLEKRYATQGYAFVIGIDEVGRGPLAGPVVACACALKCHPELISASQRKSKQILKPACQQARQVQNDKQFELIRDSKTLSEKQREGLYDFIYENFHVGIGFCDHGTIDRVNILEATYLAMKKALSDLSRKQNPGEGIIEKNIILVDGNRPIPNLSIEQEAVVNGDKLVKTISAASIVAKVTRDRLMGEMHQKFPEYGFDRHKGYGTKIHMEALRKYGACEIHRQSFRPVAKSEKIS